MDDAAHAAAVQRDASIGVLDDLLDEVHHDAVLDGADELANVDDADFGNVFGATDALSPDDMLRQLDAVTLVDDDDDDDHVAAFEDAHDDLFTLAGLANDSVEGSAAAHTDSSKTSDNDVQADEIDELADFHDSTDDSAGDVNDTDALEQRDDSSSTRIKSVESHDAVHDADTRAVHTSDANADATDAASMSAMPSSCSNEDDAFDTVDMDDGGRPTVVPTSDGMDVDTLPFSDVQVDGSDDAADAVAAPVLPPPPTPPAADTEDESTPSVLPPPAPVAVIITGSMVPSADDDDSGSDSDDDNDSNEPMALHSPLHLHLHAGADIDDDDELEVDAAVIETIQLDSTAVKQSTPSPATYTDNDSDSNKTSALLAALPPLSHLKALTGAADNPTDDNIAFSFADEVRVAHVTVPPPNPVDGTSKTTSERLESPADDNSVVGAFGIGYTSLKPKNKTRMPGNQTNATLESDDTYAVPKAPAFPDEREFERDLTLSNDLVFSVKSSADTNGDDGDDEDDEFSAVVPLDTDAFSATTLEAKRASLQQRKLEDEARVVQELKRATDAEKALNDAEVVAAMASTGANPALSDETESALSMRELHGIYKRGLGDQSVLMLDANGGDDHATSSAAVACSTPATSLSVMDRILSKPALATHAIAEGDEDGDGDDDDDSAETAAARAMKRSGAGDGNSSSGSTSTTASLAATAEWQEIQLATTRNGAHAAAAAPANNNAPQQPATSDASACRITFDDALAFCVTTDAFLEQRDAIVAEDFSVPAGRSCFACFSPRPRLTFPGALEERDRVFCVAATPLDASVGSGIFARVLQTLYMRFTHTTHAVAPTGAHWEAIGFQGNDPATDLRGCGVLSLLQMLYLVTKHADLADQCLRLSHDPTRHFPLACVLINVTRECVTTLRRGVLYKQCNKQASVFGAMNTFYVALVAELMDAVQQRSTDAFPLVLNAVLEDGRSHPDRLIDALLKADAVGVHQTPQKQTQKPHLKGTGSSGDGFASTEIAFTEIGAQAVESDAAAAAAGD